jgi:peptidoglycan-N-acetylglucosamine deacetylase
MRIAAAVCAILGVMLPAAAAEQPESCATPDALGVSRTIKIDATGGPWFGAPHGDRDFLAAAEVVLTFDDGPAPHTTRSILAALAAQCTKATFFMVGEMAAEYPDVVREVAEQGHTVGTHTWSHRNLKRLREEQMKGQIEAAFTAVEKAAGVKIAPFFRYPYLSDSPATIAYLQSRNVAQFAIDIDSFDWRTRNAQSVVGKVMRGLGEQGRGIILLHDIHASTAAAVPELLSQLKTKGYKVVHLQATEAAQTLPGYEPPTRDAHPRSLHRAHVRVRGAAAQKWMLW